MLCNRVFILSILNYTAGVSHSVWGNDLLGRGLCLPSAFPVSSLGRGRQRLDVVQKSAVRGRHLQPFPSNNTSIQQQSATTLAQRISVDLF